MEVHFLDLMFGRMSSGAASMISSSSAVKCPESLGTEVMFKGRFLSADSGRRYSFGIAASRLLSAISEISL